MSENREENKEDKKSTAKERIAEAALELFAERGYSGTTTRDIVKKAGSSLSMMGLCFGTKENMYKEVLNQVVSVYVMNTVPLFGEIVDERSNNVLNREKIWGYIEEITDIHLQIIMNPENRYIIMLLNRELQDKEHFAVDLEPALMYIYNYQMLFEDYTNTPYGSWWARTLSFQTVTGMFNLLTYPNLMTSFENIDSYLMQKPYNREEAITYIRNYHLTAIRSVLDNHVREC